MGRIRRFKCRIRRFERVSDTESENNSARLGQKVRFISNSFRRIADESTHELGITGMQSFLLGYLDMTSAQPPCQHDIEVRFNIKHPTATGLLERMAERGLVTFEQDGTDRRRKRILLTNEGLDAAHHTKQRLDDLEAMLSQGFTPEELMTLNALLDRMVENAKSAGGRCRCKEGE